MLQNTNGIVTIQQICTYAVHTVKKSRYSRQKSHREAVENGFLPAAMKVLNSYIVF